MKYSLSNIGHRIFLGEPKKSHVLEGEKVYREVQITHDRTEGTTHTPTELHVTAQNTKEALGLINFIRRGVYQSFARQII